MTRQGPAVVVLNWNGAGDTIECLRSLRESGEPAYLIVVDNGSTDDGVEQITGSGLADALLQAGSNRGYAGGNNIGLQHALKEGYDTIVVLNNDTVATTGALKPLVKTASSRRCAVSPEITYYNEPDTPWFAGGVVDKGWPRHLQPDELLQQPTVSTTECLTGCCLVAHREVWEAVGLFDESLFLIFEDSDWSLRARRAGIELVVVKESRVLHKVSRSFASGSPSLLGNFYFVRNGLVFEARYARRFLPRFVFTWLLRPTARAVVRRRGGRGVAFRWMGAAAFVLRLGGRAPRPVEWLASKLA